MEKKILVELKHVSKRFAKVLANDDVSMEIKEGEVVALLGENGAEILVPPKRPSLPEFP